MVSMVFVIAAIAGIEDTFDYEWGMHIAHLYFTLKRQTESIKHRPSSDA